MLLNFKMPLNYLEITLGCMLKKEWFPCKFESAFAKIYHIIAVLAFKWPVKTTHDCDFGHTRVYSTLNLLIKTFINSKLSVFST